MFTFLQLNCNISAPLNVSPGMVRFLKGFPEICPERKITLSHYRTFIVFLLILGASEPLFSQVDSTAMITVNGRVRDENDQPVSNAIIINKQTKTGAFGRSDGSFTVTCHKSDTLTITSLGFHTRSLCYRDSSSSNQFSAVLYLETRTYRMATIEVFAQRDLEQIQNDISKLGYNENDYMLSGINAVQSPITFLYQQFSRKEQSKRLVAQLENEDLKRELLKELFQHYVDYQIIELNDDEFDDFITYLNVSDEFMKTSSQYDFLIYVRDRFKDYKIYARQKKEMRREDFDYDKD